MYVCVHLHNANSLGADCHVVFPHVFLNNFCVIYPISMKFSVHDLHILLHMKHFIKNLKVFCVFAIFTTKP